jgi:CTD small phosphatase-like protein 2
LNITLMSGKVLKAGFNIRPYAREVLEYVNKDYEVVVFTASHKWYADVILDYIDPHNQLI